MDPTNRGQEEYGHEGERGAGANGANSPRPPRDPLTPDFGSPVPVRTVQLISGDFLLTVNPVDGSEIEPCPPGEQPARPRKYTPAEREELRRAAKAPVPPGPALPVPPLLERQEERERLVRLLARGRSVRLTGPAGSGRTALLDVVAEDCADLAPDGVVRLSGYGRAPADLLHDLYAAVYGSPGHRPDEARLLELVHDIGAVVVLDDLEFGGGALEEFLDATPECAFLLSATPDVAAPLPDSHLEEVFLGGLGRGGGLELLEQVAGRALSDDEAALAGDLWFESEGLPLRFVQAGALLRQRDQLRAERGVFDGDGSFEDAPRDAAFGDAARDVSFGDAVRDVSFGDAVRDVSFGDAARDVSFGDAVRDVSFGDAVRDVSFGDAVRDVSFGDAVRDVSYEGTPQDEPQDAPPRDVPRDEWRDEPRDASFAAGDGHDVPLPSLAEAAAPAALLASRLSESARATLEFAVALGGEVPHQAHLPALVGDTHADAALGELAGVALVAAVGSRYRLAAGVQAQLEAAGYGEQAAARAHTAAQHYAWWAGHPSVTAERAAAESDAVLAALTALVPGSGDDGETGPLSAAVLLARTAAPALAAGLAWGAWGRALRTGQEAARLAGEVAEEAYFHHELGILALLGGHLDRARAELEASIGLRGALADKRGTVAGRRALALVADRSGGAVHGGRTPAGEEVPDARYEESASPPGGVPAALAPPVVPAALATPGFPPDEAHTLVTRATRGSDDTPEAGTRRVAVSGTKRNLVAAGAGALLAAVLGTVVTLGAISDKEPPSSTVKPNQTASEQDDGDGLPADQPQEQDDSTRRPVVPGTPGSSGAPTPSDSGSPSGSPSGSEDPDPSGSPSDDPTTKPPTTKPPTTKPPTTKPPTTKPPTSSPPPSSSSPSPSSSPPTQPSQPDTTNSASAPVSSGGGSGSEASPGASGDVI
ncbi:ATP-binding protein [Streptomyces monticola]|uniref:ATP-binding protein n=1 Tax=Streptomyces monticola TaxID=2666263 RepID=A0ABW2JHH8_9ACTN